MTDRFLSLLQSSATPLLADGAMGTLLHSRGVAFDRCFDELNLTDPAVVVGVHREYLEGGARISLTNTFGANRFKLGKFGLEGRLEAINRAGVELARQAIAESSKDAFVAGDVGPLGVRIAPFGRVQPEEARAAFAGQVQVLVDAGVDLVVIETMSDLYEVREAVKTAREIGMSRPSPLPIIGSVTFTRDDRTLLGDDPAKVARALKEAGAD